jgi:uncharacterized protein YegP (UPF0339 family)
LDVYLSTPEDTSGLVHCYERTIGTPQTTDEAYGSVLFVVALLLGILGMALFVPSESAGGTRELSIVLGAAGFAPLLAGPVIRLPLQRVATLAVYPGLLLCVAAIAWFTTVFPREWRTATVHQSVVGPSAVGIAIIGIGGVVVPLVTSTRSTEEVAAAQAHSAETEAELEGVRKERDAAETARTELEAELESIRTSHTQFELYEDSPGQYRWRLRHRNGNSIADGDQRYTERNKVNDTIESVKRNAAGAPADAAQRRGARFSNIFGRRLTVSPRRVVSMAQSSDAAVEVADVDALEQAPHAEVFDVRDPRTVRLSLQAGESIPDHQHPDSMVVLYVLSGDLSLSLDGDDYELAESDAVRFDGAQDVSPTALTDAEAFLVFAPKVDD